MYRYQGSGLPYIKCGPTPAEAEAIGQNVVADAVTGWTIRAIVGGIAPGAKLERWCSRPLQSNHIHFLLGHKCYLLL